ncbi:MAG: hypothetical protein IAE89_14000 [Anaerolineae bacterium]|nr:hypothetical protein [Anaerolineae bacterium]
MKILWIGATALLFLSACQSGQPLQQVTRGDEVYFNDFSQSASFEEGSYDGATLRVRDGVYRIDVTTGDNTLWWGQWGNPHSDVIIDVDAEQTSESPETVYGVMCRVRGNVGLASTPDAELLAILTDTPENTAEAALEAEATIEVTPEATEASTQSPEAAANHGDGYLFLLQGTGQFAIMRARGRDIIPLVDWTASDIVNAAPGSNHIRAICNGHYLALYINDQFAAEATDDTYSQGQIGLVAGAANRLGARVNFDNLSVALPEG